MPKQIGDFNVTALTEKTHGYIVHRDYIAHSLRWSVAQKHINPGMRVIDAGCGVDLPLLKVLSLFPHPTSVPDSYIGIDMNKIDPGYLPKWATIIDQTNILDLDPKELGPADIITCFEVMEHMPQELGIELLQWFRDALSPTGRLLLSTPCFSGRELPKNHIYERTYDELREDLLSSGFKIDNVWGTFMTIPRLRKAIREEQPALAEVAEALEEYYSGEVMSTIFAPLFPVLASNCLWKLSK